MFPFRFVAPWATANGAAGWRSVVVALLLSLTALANPAVGKTITAEGINSAEASAGTPSREVVAKLQILLDRARFSPGVIDGRMGENVENALAAYRKENGISLKGTGIDSETWSALSRESPGQMIVPYKLTQDDVKGPFTKDIPEGLEEQKELELLGYRNPAELLAEKFHMDEDFLKELNPGADFAIAGVTIMVANVERDRKTDRTRVKRIEVYKASKQVRAYGEDDKLIAVYPASIGSDERPAPRGTQEVKGVASEPRYTYNPDYKFKDVKSSKPFTIAPGPNNPVGSVWIDLSEDGYGIHGTPEPAEVGKTASHGCVRLTNWDARYLSEMIRPGVKVAFVENK